jgi:hypothetical protein
MITSYLQKQIGSNLHTLEEILSFATKKSMTKCLKRLIINYSNTILLQILRVKSYTHILVVYLTNRQ